MNEARPLPKRLMALLALLCLALAGGLYAEVTQPIIVASTPVSTNHGHADTRPDPTFAMKPRDAYAEVVTRPLFSPTRRPAVAVAPGKISEFKLTGTIMSAQGRYALLLRRNPSKIERIVQGQIFQGWLVRSIETDHVVLERDGNLTEIGYSTVADAASPQPTAAAAAAAAAVTVAQQPFEEPKGQMPTEAGVPVAAIVPQVTDTPSAGMFRYQVPVAPTLNGGD